MSKSVVYIGGFELPDKNAAAHRVVANAKLFHSLGYKVTFVGVEKSNSAINNELVEFKVDDFTFYKKSQKYPTTIFEWFGFITDISFLKRFIEEDLNNDVAIIIAYNYPAIALKKLIAFSKNKNIKMVADITEWYVAQGNIFFRIIKEFDTFLRMKIYHKKLDGLITISRFLTEYYKKHPNVLELPPLIDKKAPKWRAIEINKSKTETDESIKLIFVGSPGNGQKDRIDYIIKLLSLAKNSIRKFELTIIGISKEQFLQIFGTDAIPENVVDQIYFFGMMPHLEALEYIKKSDFSLLIRNKNLVNTAGFPTKFVESISCGTPVIANSTSNIDKYLIEDGLGVLIDDSNQTNMLNSLIDALKIDNDRMSQLRDNCKNFNKFYYTFYTVELSAFINKL